MEMGDHQVKRSGNGDCIKTASVDMMPSKTSFLSLPMQSAALAPWMEIPELIPRSASRLADVFLPNRCKAAQLPHVL